MDCLCLLISLLYCSAVNGFTSNADQDTFLKKIHLHELGIQIQHIHGKLYEQCPNLFQTPDSVSSAIIGRRRSQDAALDLKIELAEKTLADLIQTLVNCTRSSSTRPQMTTLTHTDKSTSASLTSSTRPQPTTLTHTEKSVSASLTKESTLPTSTSTSTTTPLFTTNQSKSNLMFR